MSESVTKLCTVEAHEGAVILECGTVGTSLTPEVARDAGRRLIIEADRAEEQGKSAHEADLDGD